MRRLPLIPMLSFLACAPGATCGGQPNQMSALRRAEIASVWFEAPDENRTMQVYDFELTDAGVVLTSNASGGAVVFLDGTTESRRIRTDLQPRALHRWYSSRVMVATADGVAIFDGDNQLDLNTFYSSRRPTSRGLGGLVGVMQLGDVSELRLLRPSTDPSVLETRVIATLPGLVSALSCTEDHCLATVGQCTSRVEADGSVRGELCLERNPSNPFGPLLVPSAHGDFLLDPTNGHLVSLDGQLDVELRGTVMAAGPGARDELVVVGDFLPATPTPRSRSFHVAKVSTSSGAVQPYEVGGGLESACLCGQSAVHVNGARLTFATFVSPDHALGGRIVPSTTAAMVTLLLP